MQCLLAFLLYKYNLFERMLGNHTIADHHCTAACVERTPILVCEAIELKHKVAVLHHSSIEIDANLFHSSFASYFDKRCGP